jgi:hypothetical protein
MYGTSYLKLILISTQQVMAKLSRKPRKMWNVSISVLTFTLWTLPLTRVDSTWG